MALSSQTTSSLRNKEKGFESERETSLPNSISIASIRRNKVSKISPLVPTLTSSATRNENGIEALRYEETTAAKPPIAVIRSPPRVPPTETHPALRRPKSGLSNEDDWKRDSGLATTTSSKPREDSLAGSTLEEKDKEVWLKIDFDANSPLANAVSFSPPPMSPVTSENGLRKSDSKSSNVGGSRWKRPRSRKSSNVPKSSTEEFTPITIPIPTENLMDEEALNSIEFSKRGSMMLLGSRAVNKRENATRRQPSFSMLSSTSTTAKMLTDDLEKESQKVRSMYESGSQLSWEEGQYSSLAQKVSNPTTEPEKAPELTLPNLPFDRPGSTLSIRNEHELAGGIEDWEDIEGEDVDRYGFINTVRRTSRPGTPEPKIQRVSTMLQLASEAPRKKRSWGRATSSAGSRLSQQKAPSRKVSARSLASRNSNFSRGSASVRMRSVSNRFPGNKDRRVVEEAGDMLTLPPGLAAIAEDEEGGKAASVLRNKEIERGEKWRKMAKVVKIGADGQGMEFQFNPRNAKLIQRTWKGIPDRWRSAAWYSFLAASAAKRKDTVPDDQLVAAFHESHSRSSADDTQIDLDVPRTINSHIMFRRRYRGGQRLLFRVLHAFSLYFPQPGYVQGMAALAATLLCYYDEEKSFIMLVRMWTLRGLDKLYELGFKGLLAAINEFQEEWMTGREITEKLNDLNVESTSWGIRWYLTLFNYSIPFASQLRVWDVFMLLGDIDPSQKVTDERPFQHGLDILHATSAALMDATREIVMDEGSDFENVMKVLTSWIPIKDEELLMKVVRAEWRMHAGKRPRVVTKSTTKEKKKA